MQRNGRARRRLLTASLSAGLCLAASASSAWQPPPQQQPVPLRLDDSPALPLLAPFRDAAGAPASFLRRYLEGPYGKWHSRPWHTFEWRADSSTLGADDLGCMAAGLASTDSPGGLVRPGGAASFLLEPAACEGRAARSDARLPQQTGPELAAELGLDDPPAAADAASCDEPGRGSASAAKSADVGDSADDAAVESWIESSGAPSRWPQRAAERHWFQPEAVDLGQHAVLPEPASLSISADVVPLWVQRLDDNWARTLLTSSGCGRGGECSADVNFPAQAFEPLWNALAPKAWPIPAWQCKPRKVTIMRHGREADRFELVRCDGSIAPEALDRLSLIARPTGLERPAEVLPDEPDPRAMPGEWLPGIRIMHPRLLWVLQAISVAFPNRGIYIVSGYRPAPSPPQPGTRASYHWQGRALDISVIGVSTADVFKVCHALADVGCGYYPNKPFTHMDVRHYGDGRVFWIDVSKDGERTKYVDSWPGVVDRGAMAWAPPLGN